ncbi:hypothetical protein R3P38DRAFT_3581145 [Favolaschia claudopus]|uniref:Uncharacterized protein n=1 Tax=Favolaschia claudopus TaxID=2862362 RepID=A0AAW0AL70_9AGAR
MLPHHQTPSTDHDETATDCASKRGPRACCYPLSLSPPSPFLAASALELVLPLELSLHLTSTSTSILDCVHADDPIRADEARKTSPKWSARVRSHPYAAVSHKTTPPPHSYILFHPVIHPPPQDASSLSPPSTLRPPHRSPSILGHPLSFSPTDPPDPLPYFFHPHPSSPPIRPETTQDPTAAAILDSIDVAPRCMSGTQSPKHVTLIDGNIELKTQQRWGLGRRTSASLTTSPPTSMPSIPHPPPDP